MAAPSTSRVPAPSAPSSSLATQLQDHPFYRTLVESGAAYVQLEQERDDLCAALEHAKRDREADAKRVLELEKKLKSQHDDAERKLKAAKEREDAILASEKVQVARLQSLAHVVGGAFGATPPTEPMDEDVPLERAVSTFDAMCAYAKDALSKSTIALAAVHRNVFPQRPPPADADGLAAVLGPESSTMANFTRAQTVRGSELTFKLLLGHGVAGDFKKVVVDFPRKPDGRTTSLSSVKDEAAQLAEDMVSMVERRVAEVASRSARARSESTA